MRFATLIAAVALAILATLPAPSVRAQSVLSPDFAATEPQLSPSERAGREIWMFATAFNDRFFTYTFPQRLGGAIDWYGILGAEHRGDLFEAWGAIPDPDCCIPGDPDCPARSRHRDLGLPLVPGRRRAPRLRRPRGLPRPGLRLRGRALRHLDPARRRRPAPEHLRPLLRHLHRRARPAEVPEPALRPRRLGEDRRLGGLRRLPLRRPAEPRQPAEPALGRLGRAAVPHRHGLRRLPHRLQAGQPAGRPRPPGLGEHRRAGRQPVQPHLRAPRQRPLAAPPGVAAHRPRPAGHRRHLGAADGLRLQPRHDERDHQLRPPAAARERAC